MRGVTLAAATLLILLIALPLALADVYEPDNSIANATNISTNATWQTHNFSQSSDEDFVSFPVYSGFAYMIETQALTDVSFTDTILTIYDQSNSSYASSDDQGAANTNSLVRITPSTDGLWSARITEYDGDSGGQYQVRVTQYGVLSANITNLEFNETVTNNTLFLVNATITCENASCGLVTGILDPKPQSTDYVVAFETEEPPQNAFLRFLWRVANSGKAPAAAAIQEAGGEIQKLYEKENLAVAQMTPEQLEVLRSDPRVAGIDPNLVLSAQLDTTLPLINADDIHNLSIDSVSITGVGQTVCVIDTGIDYTHPDLGGCNSTSDINDGSCSKVIGGYDFVNSDTNPIDDDDHGTHVAGIVAGNGSTYRGVAPGASLVAIKALDENGDGSLSDVVAGMNWCITNAESLNISSISMSLGGGIYPAQCSGFSTFETAVANAHAKNISVFAASGNDNLYGMSTPACVPGIFSVGSSTDGDTRSSFSNYDPLLDIYAPGSSVRAPFLGGGYTTKSGTSMATPHVSGLSALIAQHNLLAYGRSLDAYEMLTRLLSSPFTITDSQTSAPRIDAQTSIDAKGIIPTFPSMPFWTADTNPVSCGVMSVGDQCNLSWQVNATGSNGTYEFFVIANTTEQIVESLRYNVTIFTPEDQQAPTINLTYNSSWLNYSSNITINVSDNFNLSNTSLRAVHGGLLLNFSPSQSILANVSNSTNSSTSINITLYNSSNSEANISIDNQNATILIGQVASFSDNVSAFLVSSSNSSVSLLVGAFVNDSFNSTSVNTVFEASLEGISTVVISSNDTSSNSATENATVRIDLSAPSTSASYTSGWSTSHQINLSASDDWSGVASTFLQLPNGTNLSASTYNITDEGEFNFSYFSIDVAGNYEVLNNVTFQVDASAPSVAFNFSPVHPYANQTVNVTLFVNDTSGVLNALVFVLGTVYDLNVSTLNFSYNHSLLGRVNLTANVTDLAGNIAQANSSLVSYKQFSLNATFNTSNQINASDADTELDLGLNESVNATIIFRSSPSSPFSSGVARAIRYVTIEPSSEITSRLSSSVLRIRYSDSEVGLLNESSLTMARYNESSQEWINLTDSLPFVNSVGVNSEQNFVWANITTFSTYSIAGDIPVEPEEEESEEDEEESSSSSGGGGGGGSASPSSFGFTQEVTSVATFNFLEPGVAQLDEFTRGDWVVKNASLVPSLESRYASLTLTRINESIGFAAFEVDLTSGISTFDSLTLGFDASGYDAVQMQTLGGEFIAQADIIGDAGFVTVDSLSDFALVAVRPVVEEEAEPETEVVEEVETLEQPSVESSLTDPQIEEPSQDNLVGEATYDSVDSEDRPNFWLAMILIFVLTGGALAMKVLVSKRTG